MNILIKCIDQRLQINSYGDMIVHGIECVSRAKSVKVLFLNDSPVVAVIGRASGAQLNDILETRAKEDYKKIKLNLSGDSSYEEYRRSYRWHYHNVEIIT